MQGQRHANAEMALMRRWGMLADDDVPEPNINIRLAVEWLDRCADDMPLGMLAYLPLLNRMRDNVVALGLPEERLMECMQKYYRIGNTPLGRRNPWFRVVANHAAVVVDRSNHFYHRPVDALVRLCDYIPARALLAVPSWVRELTWRPTD